MDVMKIRYINNILSNLPGYDNEGIVTVSEKSVSDGETTRVWGVEFETQTLVVQPTFDSTLEEERALMEFIAKGIPLMVYLYEKNFDLERELEDNRKAFYTVFTQLMQENADLKNQILELLPKEESSASPTVGEKGS